jgi:hypothetical protein
MTGAGNDIVALGAIDVARTRQPEFYSRIISPAELELYSRNFADHLPLEHFVWLAWSVKESAYKFLKRSDTDLIFSPSKMAVNSLAFGDGHFYGTVRSGDHLLHSRSFISNEYIFSMACETGDLSAMQYEIRRIGSADADEQSKAVRELLLDKLKDKFPAKHLQVIKSPHGWPVITSAGEELPIPVSFTHHGCFVAYTFLLNPAQWKTHHAEIL